MKPKIIVSVFNNLLTDQRIEKICGTLHENGYQVELFGCDWCGAPEMRRPYFFKRIHLKSNRLKFAYAEFQWKIYKELKKRIDEPCILVSNDLDTIIPNFILAKDRKIPLVYDSHEIFTEMPAVNGRWVQKVWQSIEKQTVPYIKNMMTANDSYAAWFEKKYGIKPFVIRNLPKKNLPPQIAENKKKIILYQGVLDDARGIDKIIDAMPLINAELWLAGGGLMKKNYEEQVRVKNLQNKVKFLGLKEPKELKTITLQADLGLSIEENKGLSYYFSLPNKISDYIQSRVPVVVSDFPEMKKIVEKYGVGETIKNHSPEHLAQVVNSVLEKGRNAYLLTLEKASQDLNWETEAPKLLAFYEKICLRMEDKS